MIEAVLPLVSRDRERFKNLDRTLKRFSHPFAKIWVVTPTDHLEDIRSLAGPPSYQVVAEEHLVSSLAQPVAATAPGWWRQQLIKLAAADLVTTPFYLTLDADCLCVRDVSQAELIQHDRGIVELTEGKNHPQWYEVSKQVLAVTQRPRKAVMVTPFLFQTALVKKLHQHLTLRAKAQANGCGNWQEFLLSCRGWTEYSLYHIFGEIIDQTFWHVHFQSQHSLFGNSLWDLGQHESWDAGQSFGQNRFLWTVVQSNTGLEASWVWQRIQPYVETP